MPLRLYLWCFWTPSLPMMLLNTVHAYSLPTTTAIHTVSKATRWTEFSVAIQTILGNSNIKVATVCLPLCQYSHYISIPWALSKPCLGSSKILGFTPVAGSWKTIYISSWLMLLLMFIVYWSMALGLVILCNLVPTDVLTGILCCVFPLSCG